MFGSIRRVISESEDLGTTGRASEQKWQPRLGETPRQCYEDSAMSAQPQSPGEDAASSAAMIEADGGDFMQVDDSDMNDSNTNNSYHHHAPLMLVHSSNQSGCGSTSSSLSGDEDDNDDAMPDEDGMENSNNNKKKNDNSQQQQQPQQQHPTSSLQPSASRRNMNDNNDIHGSALNDSNSSHGTASEDAGSAGKVSQTSRDWGWFEDVHYSQSACSEGVFSKKTKTKNSSNSNNNNQHRRMREDSERGGTPAAGDNDAAAMAVTAPTYVLEESLSSQRLWKDTAGNRPPQPLEERAFFEKMWAQNFAQSKVNYSMPVEVLTASSPISLNPFADGLGFEDGGAGAGGELSSYNITVGVVLSDQAPHKKNKGPGDAAEAALVSRMTEESAVGILVNQRVRGTGSDGDLTVLLRGPNAFGTTVSKSFARPSKYGGPISGVDTINISIASYRVVESKKYGKYAQFLVIYREGSIRDTIGIWKRYRDFEGLARKVTHAHEGCTSVIANMAPLHQASAAAAAAKASSSSSGGGSEDAETEHLPNAVTSWCLLKKRKRWYRCLDAGYLSLKVFLLERFLHDILFESSSPQLLRDFVLGSQNSRDHGDSDNDHEAS